MARTMTPLTMTPEREAWYRSPEGIACAPLYVPDMLAEIDSTRAKLAEAEAQRDEANNVRDQYEARMVAAERGYDAAESRVAALTLTLAKCKGALDEVGILSVTEAQRIVYATIEAALSPSQDAKGGA